MTPEERKILQNDFPLYAKNCLRIVGKGGGVQKFVLNDAQKYLHERLEEQRREQGCIRALVLKGRQQGVSTYVGGRFFWRVTHRAGVSAFILTHRTDTTKALFGMTQRYLENCPKLLRPAVGIASASEIWFSKLDSRYRVGTAGGVEIGRGLTVQYFHGSEIAFWESAEEHLQGIFQSIPSGEFAEGTEIVLESTANGMNNKFYDMWQDAEAGRGEYIAVFIPWFWQKEYRSKLPKEGWEVPAEDVEYQKLYNLTDEQMYWRYLKIIENNGDKNKFQQEYPATAQEAFTTSLENVFIDMNRVAAARQRKYGPAEIRGAVIIGVDPSLGGDETAIAVRKGRALLEVKAFRPKNREEATAEVASKVIDYIHKYDPDRVFVDIIGIGEGVYSVLKERGYGKLVKGVNAASRDVMQEKYFNKRAECWGNMKDWYDDNEELCQIPDDAQLQKETTMLTYKTNISTGQIQLQSKEELRRAGEDSPNKADAVSLTFAFPVKSEWQKKIIVEQNAKVEYADEYNPFSVRE